MKAIVAVDEGWGIGRDGAMLFHIPPDLAYFRQMTMGHTVIMGRATFLALPNGPLPGRRNVILSRSLHDVPGACVYPSLESLLADISQLEMANAFVIGGQQVYETMLDMCDTAYVTKILEEATKTPDRFFPDISAMPVWHLASSSEIHEHNNIRFRFDTYIKICGQ